MLSATFARVIRYTVSLTRCSDALGLVESIRAMGIYLRKSIRVGPLRFNLSGSGIGVSTGIPGLRIGFGPRGNYVHAGRGGLYYRATLPSLGSKDRQPSQPLRVENPLPRGFSRADLTLGPFEVIDSASVAGMKDESADALLAELNSKRQRWRIAPFVTVLGLVVAAMLWTSMLVVGQVIALIGVPTFVILAVQYDALRKSTVIMYHLEPDAEARFETLISAVQEIGRAKGLWAIESQAQVLDGKYHAGASSEVNRKPTSITLGQPSFVKCNLDVPALGVGKQTVYFFPDRLLVFDADSVGAVPYEALRLERSTRPFIESDAVPSDSQIVGRTWRYVNKKGGPDRRFSNNRELPICEYESLQLRSASGLNELVQVSRVGAGEPLSQYLSQEVHARPI